MNANEVIANRAPTKCGRRARLKKPGPPERPREHGPVLQRRDPHRHARRGAGRDPATTWCRPWTQLSGRCDEKAEEFDDVVKIGRTHLQDATPIRLGQEFEGYAGQIERGMTPPGRRHARTSREVALGGTAVGTGINTHPDFARASRREQPSRASASTFARDDEPLPGAEREGRRRRRPAARSRPIAVSLLKIANDIRWLGSGPRGGIGEIALPEMQPGSSIMPGKVNPVIAESVAMVAAQVIGNDATITIAGPERATSS